MMATTTAPAPATPSPVAPSGMGQGSAMASLARAPQTPAQAAPAPSQAANQIMHAPATAATGSGFVPETGTPTQRAVAMPNGLPTQQSSMLHDLASISLGFANPVAPGQVTKQQQQVLSAWQQNAQSDYSQYMASHGFSNLSADPGALFNEEALVAQSQWSVMDTQGAMTALKLSVSDYDQWMKIEQEKKKEKGALIGKVFEIAGAVVGFVYGGPAGAMLGAEVGGYVGGAVGGAT